MELKVFENEKYGQVRTVEKDGEPWFMARDVCNVLEIKNITQAMNRIKDKHKVMLNISLRGSSPYFVSEAGLYKLVLQSRKEEAEQFQDWMVEEVIPSIRKHGVYATPKAIEELLSDPDSMIKIFQTIKEERAKNAILTAKVETDAPKVAFAEAIENSQDVILVGVLAKMLQAKGYKIGQKDLFKWLRLNNYLCSKGDNYNLPSIHSVRQGLMEIREYPYMTSDGRQMVSRTPVITGKGQMYFVNKMVRG